MDLGIPQTDLQNTTGIITIGHSSEAQVASFNESSLEALMTQIGRRGDGTDQIEFLGLWGCKSSKFHDRNRTRRAPYPDENAAIFGCSTWEVGPKFHGFGKRLNPFGSDPLFDYLDRPVDAQLGGEFSVFDPLGYAFGDLLMESF